MGSVVKKIVLTGGPCAGKSSSLELIENYLRDNNYIVYIVQESATELIKSGIKPYGEDGLNNDYFQDVLFKYQLEKEKLIENIAETINVEKDIIIIYDRGLLDNKAYIGQQLYNKLLKKYNFTEKEILDRYDLVIHLETGAKNNNYNKDNSARSENLEDAIELDNKTFDAWKNHKNLIKVKCRENFEEKQKEMLNIIDKNILMIL